MLGRSRRFTWLAVGALTTALVWSGGVASANEPGPPVVHIGSPVDGAVVLANHWLPASYACAPQGSRVLVSCEGTVPDGEPVDTSVGAHVFTVQAVDDTGAVTEVSAGYVALGSITGSLVEAGPHRAGAGLTLTLDGAFPPKSDAVAAATATQVSCWDQSVIEGVAVPAKVRDQVHMKSGALSLRWHTERTWGGTCQLLTLTFGAPGWEGVTMSFGARFA